MLKERKNGTWLIENQADLDAAMDGIEERQQAIEELEKEMEEQYDYLTMKTEIVSLNEAVKSFMIMAKQKHIFRDGYKLTLVQRASTKWNPERLKKLVPKPMWLKITDQVVSPKKIDDLVKQGKLDDKLIAPALQSTPQAPFVQRYPYKEGQSIEDAQAEEMALRQAMTGEAKEKSGSKRK